MLKMLKLSPQPSYAPNGPKANNRFLTRETYSALLFLQGHLLSYLWIDFFLFKLLFSKESNVMILYLTL